LLGSYARIAAGRWRTGREKEVAMPDVAKGVVIARIIACLVAPITAVAAGQQTSAQITRPAIADDVAPLQTIAPTARDGTRGEGFLRKPPGSGPFPAVVLIHGGITRWPTQRLREYALATWPSRFLAAGYVIAAITYRSRDVDPQSREGLDDAIAAVDYLRRLPYIDANSIAVNGTSGGGDLALFVAADTDVAVIVPEEPASVMFTGIFNKEFPKKGERFIPGDVFPILAEPSRYYTSRYQEVTRERVARIRCPILIVQGDVHPINRFNREILIPELRVAGKPVEILTYPGEPHSFAFYSVANRTPRPAVALKAFDDINAFLRRHLRTQPVPIDSHLVNEVPF
jgi:dipeptidyl aminopeptidase/acylaminoacyl peptidase